MDPQKNSAVIWLRTMGYEPVTKMQTQLFNLSHVMEALSAHGELPCPREVLLGLSTHQYECKIKGCSGKLPIGLQGKVDHQKEQHSDKDTIKYVCVADRCYSVWNKRSNAVRHSGIHQSKYLQEKEAKAIRKAYEMNFKVSIVRRNLAFKKSRSMAKAIRAGTKYAYLALNNSDWARLQVAIALLGLFDLFYEPGPDSVTSNNPNTSDCQDEFATDMDAECIV